MAHDSSPGGVTFTGEFPDQLVPLRSGSDQPPLFCIHAVSGSPYAYSGLASLLSDSQPVYGFEAPGFDNDRPPVADLLQLADEYTEILRTVASGQEYRLLGWSLGGLVAFEIAKRLHAAGEEVTKLILVDAPLPRVQALPPERDILLRFINDMMGLSEEAAAPGVRSLFAGWPQDVSPATAFPLVEQAEILPEEMDAALLADQYAVFRALLGGFYAIEVAGSYSGAAVHILAGVSSGHEMDWSKVLPRVRDITVPGTHYTIWSGQSLVLLSKIVQATLDTR